MEIITTTSSFEGSSEGSSTRNRFGSLVSSSYLKVSEGEGLKYVHTGELSPVQ